jgi:hypothetical protein
MLMLPNASLQIIRHAYVQCLGFVCHYLDVVVLHHALKLSDQ